jgi:esterase/lipase
LLGPTPALDLSRITAPTLVLASREDRLVPCAHSLSIGKEIRERRRRSWRASGTSMRSKPLHRWPR